MQFFRKLIKDSKGATAIEYGLIAALIAVAAISAMSTLGGKISTTFNNVSDNLKESSAPYKERRRRGHAPPPFSMPSTQHHQLDLVARPQPGIRCQAIQGQKALHPVA